MSGAHHGTPARRTRNDQPNQFTCPTTSVMQPCGSSDNPPGFDKIFSCEGQSLDQMSIDNRHRWIVMIPASTLYLIYRNLVAQTNFKQPRPVLAGHKQTSAGGVVSDAVGHSFSVCAETFDVFGRRDHARS